ncbi:PilZ domain-containing protein [Sphingorhabdus sp. EL138]|jgi:hypothetical protein|uniref:PilZ domain-containing protein n=1 Tax=Sphingorhabdus sp. EL138 TaxID=2073156 RepID=UPI000D69972E|nr:PilZ domain-containing protein [Sphingorhabdus sp. EL138]
MAKPFENTEAEQKQEAVREPRIRKLVKIELFTDNSGPHEAMVRNLSTFGIRATAPIDLFPEQSIVIKKAGFGSVSGTVRWVEGREFGMQFDQSIDVDLFNFGLGNEQGHFVKKIDNGHVWLGFQNAVSSKRPGFHKR